MRIQRVSSTHALRGKLSRRSEISSMGDWLGWDWTTSCLGLDCESFVGLAGFLYLVTVACLGPNVTLGTHFDFYHPLRPLLRSHRGPFSLTYVLLASTWGRCPPQPVSLIGHAIFLTPPSDWLRLFLSQTFSRINTPTVSTWLFFLLTPPMKMERTECSETSGHKCQMPGNHRKSRIQHSK